MRLYYGILVAMLLLSVCADEKNSAALPEAQGAENGPVSDPKAPLVRSRRYGGWGGGWGWRRWRRRWGWGGYGYGGYGYGGYGYGGYGGYGYGGYGYGGYGYGGYGDCGCGKKKK